TCTKGVEKASVAIRGVPWRRGVTRRWRRLRNWRLAQCRSRDQLAIAFQPREIGRRQQPPAVGRGGHGNLDAGKGAPEAAHEKKAGAEALGPIGLFDNSDRSATRKA